jgi:hypothetical protein
MTTRRKASMTWGQTTRFAVPVSSSSVTKHTPLAEPGFWRIRTSPASRTPWRLAASARSRAAA